MNLRRRLRGILGAAVLWGAGFAGISALVILLPALVGNARPPGPSKLFEIVASAMTAWAVIGAVAGALFAVTVVLTERRRTLGALSSRRFALWGFTAGALLPLAVTLGSRAANHVSIGVDGTALVVSLICGTLGGGIAATTLRLARKNSPILPSDHAELPRLNNRDDW